MGYGVQEAFRVHQAVCIDPVDEVRPAFRQGHVERPRFPAVVPLNDLARGVLVGGLWHWMRARSVLSVEPSSHIDNPDGSFVPPGSDINRPEEVGDVQLFVEGRDDHLNWGSFRTWIDGSVMDQSDQAEEDGDEEEDVGRAGVGDTCGESGLRPNLE